MYFICFHCAGSPSMQVYMKSSSNLQEKSQATSFETQSRTQRLRNRHWLTPVRHRRLFLRRKRGKMKKESIAYSCIPSLSLKLLITHLRPQPASKSARVGNNVISAIVQSFLAHAQSCQHHYNSLADVIFSVDESVKLLGWVTKTQQIRLFILHETTCNWGNIT